MDANPDVYLLSLHATHGYKSCTALLGNITLADHIGGQSQHVRGDAHQESRPFAALYSNLLFIDRVAVWSRKATCAV